MDCLLKWGFGVVVRRLLVLAILSNCLLGIANAAILALPEDGETGIPAEAIAATSDGIRITVTNQPLREVLQAIQNRSGIRFEVAGDLMEESITESIEAANWSAAVRKLLKPFNRLEILNEDQTLQRVLVVKATRGKVNVPPIRGGRLVPAEGPPGTPKPPSGAAEANSDPGTATTPPGITARPSAETNGPPQDNRLLPGPPPAAGSPPGSGPPSDQPPPDGEGPPGY